MLPTMQEFENIGSKIFLEIKSNSRKYLKIQKNRNSRKQYFRTTYNFNYESLHLNFIKKKKNHTTVEKEFIFKQIFTLISMNWIFSKTLLHIIEQRKQLKLVFILKRFHFLKRQNFFKDIHYYNDYIYQIYDYYFCLIIV